MALPGRHCLSCYWNLAPWFTGALCSHMCSHAQESHSPHQAGCRGREAWLWAGVLPGPSLLGTVLLGTSQSSSRGSCSRCSPSGASTEHVCSAARGGSWAQAPAQPQVTGAHLQPGAEERAAVPSAAASAWQVCGAGRAALPARWGRAPRGPVSSPAAALQVCSHGRLSARPNAFFVSFPCVSASPPARCFSRGEGAELRCGAGLGLPLAAPGPARRQS